MVHKAFTLLVGSQLFSVLGTTLTRFILSLYVLDVTQSSAAFGAALACGTIGQVLLLPFCGILADRAPKRQLMLLMDGLYLALTIGLLAAAYWQLELIWLLVLVAAQGMVSAFETPVVQSTIPLLCAKEDIPKANSLINAIGLLANVIGPIVASLLYRIDRLVELFAGSSLLFVLAIGCELLLRVPYQKREQNGAKIVAIVRQDIQETVRYLRSQKAMIAICYMLVVLNGIVLSFEQIIIPYVVRVPLQMDELSFGILNTAVAIGGLLGAVGAGALSRYKVDTVLNRTFLVCAVSVTAVAIPFMLFHMPQLAFWLLCVATLVMTAGFALIMVQLVSYVQIVVPSALVGRLMSFLTVLSLVALPFGQLLFGFIGERLNQFGLVALALFVGAVTYASARYSRKWFAQMLEMEQTNHEANITNQQQ